MAISISGRIVRSSGSHLPVILAGVALAVALGSALSCGGDGGGPPTQQGHAPTAPANLQVVVLSATSAHLTWTDQSTDETGFHVYRGPSGQTHAARVATVGPNVQSYDDAGLSPGTTYGYCVHSFSNNGESAVHVGGTVTTPAAATATIVLNPTSVTFTATQGGSSPAAKTVAVTNGGGGTLSGLAVGTITYGAGASGWLQAAVSPTSAPATVTLTATLGSLAAGTYTASVPVTSGVASNSPQTIGVTFTVGAPSSGPTLSTPTVSNTTITLTWTYTWPQLGSTNDAYLLEESTTGSGSGFTQIASYAQDTHVSPYTQSLTRTTAGTYWYRVRVRNYAGLTGYSEVQSATVTLPAQISAYPSVDNAMMSSSLDATLATKVFSTSDNAAGCEYLMNLMYGYDYTCVASALKFDVQSQIAGRSVKTATLRLYVHMLRGDFSVTPTYLVAALVESWSTTTMNWNTLATMSYRNTGARIVNAPSTGTLPVDIDVTTIVQNWASGGFANNGILLYPYSGYPGYTPSLEITYFYSRESYDLTTHRPQLIVEFQ